MRRLALALSLLILGGCGRPAPERAAAPPADVSLVTESVHLGLVAPGGWIRGALRLRAGSGGALLTQVAPSCGCTISLTEVPVQLEAGAEIDAPLAMDLSRLSDLGAPQGAGPRRIERDVVVASQSGTRLTARVSVDVSDRVIVDPAQPRFATVPPGGTAQGELRVRAATGAPAPKITGVEVEAPGVTATWEADPASPSGDILVRLAWTPSEPGPLEGRLVLRLEDPADDRLSVRVTGQSEAAVSVDPPRLENLAAQTSRPMVARLTLSRADGLPLAILGASCSNHRVQVRVDEAADSPVRTLQVIVPVLALPQEVEGLITIRTDAPGGEILTVPVRVRARA